jgi:uncharacterized protein
MRLTQPSLFQLKSVDQAGRFSGYAAVYGNIDAHGDVIAPGCFAESLRTHARQGSMPAMLWSHDPTAPVGAWHDLAEDNHGLRAEGQLTLEVAAAREAHALLKAGAVTGLSVGMRIAPGDITKAEHGGRLIRRAELAEVSLVSLPANPAARVTAVKALQDRPQSLRDFERALRGLGFSGTEAKTLAARGWRDPHDTRSDDLRELLALIEGVALPDAPSH